MSMIFPGMDPYLESPQLWPDVHSRLIVYIAEHLHPLLRPRYFASVQTRVFVEGPEVALLDAGTPVEVRVPELEIHETFLQIIDLQSGQQVVTVLEAVSPTNKYAGPGRESYLAKQREVRASQAHLVEIDLLRAGPHVLAVPEWVARGQGAYDYLVCVNRAKGPRGRFHLYPCRLEERLPRIRIPLAEGDPDVVLDLQAVLAHTCAMGGYRERIDYDAPCVPPLSSERQAWANERIQEARRTGA